MQSLNTWGGFRPRSFAPKEKGLKTEMEGCRMRAQSFRWPQAVNSSCREGVWIHRGVQWALELKGCTQGFRRHRGHCPGGSGLARQLARQCRLAEVTAGTQHGVGITLLLGTTEAQSAWRCSARNAVESFQTDLQNGKAPASAAMSNAGNW